MIELAPGIGYDEGYFALHLYFVPLEPQKLQFAGQEWRAKQELHCSLVSGDKLAKRIADESGRDMQRLIAGMFTTIQNFLKEHPLTQADLGQTDVFRFVAKDDGRRSIVRMVEVPGIRDLFGVISDGLAIDLPVQPTYITLYTGPDGRDIGLLSEEELTRFTRQFSDQEVAEFKRATNVDRILA